jgi:hypothetical protein
MHVVKFKYPLGHIKVKTKIIIEQWWNYTSGEKQKYWKKTLSE